VRVTHILITNFTAVPNLVNNNSRMGLNVKKSEFPAFYTVLFRFNPFVFLLMGASQIVAYNVF